MINACHVCGARYALQACQRKLVAICSMSMRPSHMLSISMAIQFDSPANQPLHTCGFCDARVCQRSLPNIVISIWLVSGRIYIGKTFSFTSIYRAIFFLAAKRWTKRKQGNSFSLWSVQHRYQKQCIGAYSPLLSTYMRLHGNAREKATTAATQTPRLCGRLTEIDC